jgi:hypothetical protein
MAWYFSHGPIFARAKVVDPDSSAYLNDGRWIVSEWACVHNAACQHYPKPSYQAWISIYRRPAYYKLDIDTSKSIIVRYVECSDGIFRKAQRLRGEVDYHFADQYFEILLDDKTSITDAVSKWVENLDDFLPEWKSDYPF